MGASARPCNMAFIHPIGSDPCAPNHVKQEQSRTLGPSLWRVNYRREDAP